MTRDRYGIDSDRLSSKPPERDGSPSGRDDVNKRAHPEERDDYIKIRPFRGGQRQGPPDSSRASNAERYSHHKRPLE